MFQVSLLGSTKVVTTSLSDLISQAKKASEGGAEKDHLGEVESKAKVKEDLSLDKSVTNDNFSDRVSWPTLKTCSNRSKQWRMLTAAASVPRRLP